MKAPGPIWRGKSYGAAALATVLGLFLAGCSVLQIDVDVYKGPLANHQDVQVEQLAAMAVGAQPLLVQLRDTLWWDSNCNVGERTDKADRDRDSYAACIQKSRGEAEENGCYKNGYISREITDRSGNKCPILFLSYRADRVNKILGLYERYRDGGGGKPIPLQEFYSRSQQDIADPNLDKLGELRLTPPEQIDPYIKEERLSARMIWRSTLDGVLSSGVADRQTIRDIVDRTDPLALAYVASSADLSKRYRNRLGEYSWTLSPKGPSKSWLEPDRWESVLDLRVALDILAREFAENVFRTAEFLDYSDSYLRPFQRSAQINESIQSIKHSVLSPYAEIIRTQGVTWAGLEIEREVLRRRVDPESTPDGSVGEEDLDPREIADTLLGNAEVSGPTTGTFEFSGRSPFGIFEIVRAYNRKRDMLDIACPSRKAQLDRSIRRKRG